MDLSHNSKEPVLLNHGYDESKPLSELTLADMQQAAAFRGGKCLTAEGDLTAKRSNSEAVQQRSGLMDTQLEWQCAQGHTFKASPRLILLGGHWCPDCFPWPYDDTKEPARPWNWDVEAKRNPFFAQLWSPLHDANENNTYGSDIFDGWEK
jgi:hypothetical protein